MTAGDHDARDPSPAPAPGPETSLLFDVFAVGQAVGRLLADAMRDGPLTPAEYAVASAIFELEAATPTRIAARLGMRLTTFMDQLRAFEQRGHVRRIAHPTDGRSYRVVLTGEGLAAHRAANRSFEAAAAAFGRELGGPPEETAARTALLALRAAADVVRERLGAEVRVATPPSGGRAG